MAVRDNILEGLAWAGISEKARVARISALLVRELHSHTTSHTKTRVKQAVRNTSPPHGRGKFIIEAVTLEYQRQLPIYLDRKAKADEWNGYLAHQAKRSTRVNNAYAAAFDRPSYAKARSFEGEWNDYDGRSEWNRRESDRDKGDECDGLTHQGDYVVALVKGTNTDGRQHVVTRRGKGPIVRTYLRSSYDEPKNLVEAAVSLGGSRVKAAIGRGKRVKTDWVERASFIHHDGSDHHSVGVERVPWRIAIYEEEQGRYGTTLKAVPAVIDNGIITRSTDERFREWNDLRG